MTKADAGRISGLLNKKLGRGYCGLTLEQRQEAGSKGGMLTGSVNGLKNKELERGWFAPGMQAKAGFISCHNRWHAKRGVVDPFCELCQGEQFTDDDSVYDSKIRHRDIEVEGCQCQGCIKIRRSENKRPFIPSH
jgi:hypothetical protein